MQEARRARVELARELLATTELPLHEIAKGSGFSSGPLLSVALRRELGSSPGAYRRSMRNSLVNGPAAAETGALAAARALRTTQPTEAESAVAGAARRPLVELYLRDSDAVVASCGSYLLQVVKERATVSTVSAMGKALTDLAARRGSFGFLCLVERDACLLPNEEVTSALQAVAQRFELRASGSAAR